MAKSTSEALCVIHVAVGVIKNESGQIFITERMARSELAGCWEFPGGKREAGESMQQALVRELREEIGIETRNPEFLMEVPYQYPGKDLLLSVWVVTQFEGEPYGREGQRGRWIAPHELVDYTFPAANHPIVNVLAP